MPRSLPQDIRPRGIAVQGKIFSRFGCSHTLRRSERLVVDDAPPLASFEVLEDLLGGTNFGHAVAQLLV